MSFTQLPSPLPVFVIDKGTGMAFGVIDYGPEHNLIWVSALDDSGEIWCAPNPKVRVRGNWTMGREAPREEAEARRLPGGGGWAEPRAAHARTAETTHNAGHAPGHQLRAVHIAGADAEHSAFP